MLKITVEGDKEEIKRAKNVLEDKCLVSTNYCLDPNRSCEKCEKGKVEIKYVVKED